MPDRPSSSYYEDTSRHQEIPPQPARHDDSLFPKGRDLTKQEVQKIIESARQGKTMPLFSVAEDIVSVMIHARKQFDQEMLKRSEGAFRAFYYDYKGYHRRMIAIEQVKKST